MSLKDFVRLPREDNKERGTVPKMKNPPPPPPPRDRLMIEGKEPQRIKHAKSVLTDEQKETLKLLANSWASFDDMAAVLGFDPEKFAFMAKTDGYEIKEIITRERLLSKSRVMKSVFDMAAAGSNVAQQIALKVIEKRELDEQFND